MFNPPPAAKRIWEILQAARAGLGHALPLKTRPEEWENVKAQNRYEVISEIEGNRNAVVLEPHRDHRAAEVYPCRREGAGRAHSSTGA